VSFHQIPQVERLLSDSPARILLAPKHGDSEDSDFQRYKKLRHCCLKFGSPTG
jgi:hypothetical protein